MIINITENPAAIPSMCGAVARTPNCAPEQASITLFGPGVMYIVTAKPIMGSRMSCMTG